MQFFKNLFTSKEKAADDVEVDVPSFIHHEDVGKSIRNLIASTNLSDESLVKVTRQLEFWYQHGNLSSESLLALSERLVNAAVMPFKEDKNDEKFKVPTRRFGRTEIQMPIVTMGGMRVQHSWFPDNVPVLSFADSSVLKSPSQEQLKGLIRLSLKLGINHFETARMYGTSEMQFADALYEMISSGEIQRNDFILQTKILPAATTEAFQKSWDASWSKLSRFEYIDLFAFHVVSSDWNVDSVLDDCENSQYSFMSKLKEKGTVRHIGFSTHGSSENIMKLISSNKFDYVNMHCHYFGDYHGTGTPDSCGGQGNVACAKKALELDMGLFLISPYDKGGALYKPSKSVALTIGEKMTPMAFASLYAWHSLGFHTISVGVGRASDFVECYEAAQMFERDGIKDEISAADSRLRQLAEEKLGKEWNDEGLLNIPSYYREETGGMAIGHILWCLNLLEAYGMYDFAKARYAGLESTKASWKKGVSFQENAKKMSTGNPGTCFDDTFDLDQALMNHFSPKEAKEKLEKSHAIFRKGADFTDEDRKKYEAEVAYDLNTWTEFPGDIGKLGLGGVMVQVFSRNKFGEISRSGPTQEFSKYASKLRRIYSDKH